MPCPHSKKASASPATCSMCLQAPVQRVDYVPPKRITTSVQPRMKSMRPSLGRTTKIISYLENQQQETEDNVR